jgi:hypothetical protein
MLGSTVGSSYGRTGDASYGTDVDDASRLILTHGRDDGARDFNGSEHVGFKVSLDFFAAETQHCTLLRSDSRMILYRRPVTEASIVDEDIYPSEKSKSVANDIFDIRRSNIKGDPLSAGVLDLLDELRSFGRSA